MLDNEFNLKKFFQDNSSLFVIISVFSALSLYFTTFLSTTVTREKTTIILAKSISFNPLEYVILACFLIVIIILAILLKQLLYNDKNEFFPIYYWIGENAIKRIFLIIALLFIAGGIILTIFLVYTQLIFPFFVVLATFFSVVTFITCFVYWIKFYTKYTNNNPDGCISLLSFSIISIVLLSLLFSVASKIKIFELAFLLIWFFSIIGFFVLMLTVVSILQCLYRILQIYIFPKIMRKNTTNYNENPHSHPDSSYDEKGE